MLVEIARRFAREGDEQAAIDSTGMETTSDSAHFQARSGRKGTRYVKLSICVMTGSLLPAGVVASWGPASDKREAPELLLKSSTAVQPERLFADAGYDAEWVHEYWRDEWQVESVIKPAVHRSDGGLNGRDRSQMDDALNRAQAAG